MDWIDRQKQEPPWCERDPGDTTPILVWTDWGDLYLAEPFDEPGKWTDTVERCTVLNFRYWQPAPKSPYEKD